MRACPFSLDEIARATSGELCGDGHAPIAGVCTDTRDALAGNLFVALKGERFDAHDFLDRAQAAGAAAFLISRSVPGLPAVVVRDTLKALGDLAWFHRARMKTPVVALTGSNGKTTTKEMIAAIFGESRRVLKTEGNLNNLIGVPMTLFGLTSEHEVAVIEMGMNTPGEIARYTEIAVPQVGLVLNVGPAHIGMLGSLDAIGDAKGELYEGLAPDATAVVNIDDPQVARVAKKRNKGAPAAIKRTFGRSAGADVRLLAYQPSTEGGRAKYSVDGVELEVDLPIAGEHNAMNAAGAIALCTSHHPNIADATHDEIRAGLKNARFVGGRMVFQSIGRWLVVDDCYNANSASMLAAIETIRARAAAAGKRFIAVLGEMRELGAYAPEEHAKVGRAVAAAKPAFLAAFGPEAAAIASEAKAGGVDTHYEAADADALWRALKAQLRDGDLILVKGSRGMKMERFIEKMREETN